MADPKDTKIQDNTMTSGDLPARHAPDEKRDRPPVDAPADGRRGRRADDGRAPEALGASARSMPVEERAERAAAQVRAIFARMNPEQVVARLPHWLQNNAIRGAMPEILTAVAKQIVEAETATHVGEAPRAYKTVDRAGNIRDIVPGHEPRGRLVRELRPFSRPDAAFAKAPPPSTAPPAPAAPNGETRFAPSPLGPR